MNILNKIDYVIRDSRIFINTVFSKYKKNKINAYWCRANNFGDWLTPEILKHYGSTPIYTSAYDADIISVGSIMEQIPKLYKGNILGTGYIMESSILKFPKANILGVRGKLTEIKFKNNNDVVLGDPGLLISKIVNNQNRKKKYKIGVLPHLSDKHTSVIKLLKSNSAIKIIDPQQSPKKVAKDVLECESILSSSLHGLIFADSYGIPNRRIVISGRLTGGDFKFNDYYSLLNVNETAIRDLKGDETVEKLQSLTKLKNQDTINKLIQSLDKEFLKLSRKYETTKS